MGATILREEKESGAGDNANRFQVPQVDVSFEVEAAIQAGKPVVALESTIIAHGMPYPQNLETARSLEAIVRVNGAIPATVAVLHGVPHVGLTDSQLRLLASPSSKVRKLAKRDLPLAFASGAHGATTVSATMAISAAAGVEVFATGGIGGVHRGVTESWDVSADIAALAAIGQVVVCAGVKSLLDVEKTLEALETAGVPVLVLRHDKFPGFYTRGSLKAPARVETEGEVARVFLAAREGKVVKSGILLAVPVPEESEADAGVVQDGVNAALRELEEAKGRVRAGEVTPFLLRRVTELTGGASLKANIALARNNAATAARVSVEICRVRALIAGEDVTGGWQGVEVVVVGGIAVDITCEGRKGARLQLGVSNRGQITERVGGVGKNIAEVATRVGKARTTFFSAVGDDERGGFARRALVSVGVDVRGIKTIAGARTAACCVVHDENGELAVGIGDFDDMFGSDMYSVVRGGQLEMEVALRHAKIACMDGNISESDMLLFTSLCQAHGVPCWFEPTTPQKAARLVRSGCLDRLSYLSPNETELDAMAEALAAAPATAGVAAAARTVLDRAGGRGGQCLLVTRGARGVSRFRLRGRGGAWEMVHTAFPAIRVDAVRSTTGAGDCFAGVCVAALARGIDEDEAIRMGVRAAAACVRGDAFESAAAVGRSTVTAKL